MPAFKGKIFTKTIKSSISFTRQTIACNRWCVVKKRAKK